MSATQHPQIAKTAGWMRWAPFIVIALFVALGIWYSLVVPPFETPDEVHHYAFARNIAQGHGLPVQTVEGSGAWAHEGSQAPLYYLLVGGLTAGIEQDDFDALSIVNPRGNIGDPLFPGNKNRMLYSGALRPLQGANLAMHIGRWFSLLLGAASLWLIYRIGLMALPGWPLGALLAMLLAASIPQFAFISASVSNDNAIIFTSTLVLYWLARLLVKDHGKPVRLWELTVLGLLLGLAALSKLPGLGLVGLAGLTILMIAYQRRDWRLPFIAILPVAIGALAVAGWWYVRNLTLYGSLLGVNELLSANGMRQEPLTWGSAARGEFRGLRYSFWGLFGWFNILLPNWLYSLMDVLSLIAGAGLIVGAIQGLRRRGATFFDDPVTGVRAMLTIWALMLIGLIIYWATFATSSQGRLLFPGIAAFSILMMLGLSVWMRKLPAKLSNGLLAMLPALLLGCSLYALIVLLPNAYRQPAPIAIIPTTATNVALRYGDEQAIQVHALTVADARFQPGESVPVTLYLSADRPLDEDYQLFIQLLDENGEVVGNVTTHPGWGRNPTSLWDPGAIYADDYLVRIDQPIDNRAPLLATIYAGFIDPTTEVGREFLPVSAFNEAGERVTPFVGHVVIEPRAQPDFAALDAQATAAHFGDVIELAGVDLPAIRGATDPLTATLLWEAIGQPATDYTAFVHLRDEDGNTLAGFDQAPAGVRFPTRTWRAGDRIVSEFPLTPSVALQPGNYELWLGLYEAASQGAVRLPVTDAGQLESADGEVKIGALEIQATTE